MDLTRLAFFETVVFTLGYVVCYRDLRFLRNHTSMVNLATLPYIQVDHQDLPPSLGSTCLVFVYYPAPARDFLGFMGLLVGLGVPLYVSIPISHSSVQHHTDHGEP